MNTESRMIRYGALVMFAGGSIGLAWSLSTGVVLWLGWAALVVCWLPVAMRLLAVERERLEATNRTPAVEPWQAVPAEEQV